MNWKDYFYFEKRDKNAIILLLFLILVSGGIYLFVQDGDRCIDDSIEADYRALLNVPETTDTSKKRIDRISATTHFSNKLKPGDVIDLNSADTTDLKRIPGIGSAYSNRIVKYRESLGGFASINQLHEIWGLDDDLYKKIKPYLIIKGSSKKLKINTLDLVQLKKHPYINHKQAKVIIDIRHRKGKITSINRLALLDEFTEKDITRLEKYLSFE